MSRKIIALWMTVLLLATGWCTVTAATFDPHRTGAVTVTLTEPKTQEPLVGAELNLYRVATVARDAAGQLIYEYTDGFEQMTVALDDPSAVSALEAYVAEHRPSCITAVTDARGRARWEDLPLGLYFVQQTGAVAGFAPCTSFLVTVPTEQKGAYVYQVNATPKTEVTRLVSITIKKVWNTDAATPAADSVTVHLLKDGNPVKKATLSAANHWQITYTDMPESDAYSVKEVNVPKGFTATYRQKGYVFTVTNTSTLIQTGQLVWPIPLLAVSGLLLIALGATLLRKKRDAHE